MSEDLIPLTDGEFRYITGMLYERFGISLSDQKRVLVAGRLTKRLRHLGLNSFTKYIDYLSADTTGAELSEMINRITTNHSFFFREKEHFDFMTRTILPGLDGGIKRNPRYPLRIWSAGCATGEEVYSIGMLLKEHYGPAADAMDIGLLATDISLAALQEAQNAVYAEHKLRELPATWRMNYFKKNGPDDYVVSNDITKMVLFKRLNLMAEHYPMRGQFDIIFCRNVMIYFDQESRARVVRTMFNYVKPGGYFFVGHSESLKRETCPFDYVKPAIYRKKE